MITNISLIHNLFVPDIKGGNKLKSYNKKHLIFLIVLIIIIVPIFLIQTQYIIKVTGAVHPKNEFHIILKQNNDIHTVLIDILKGRIDKHQIITPNRGDITSIDINSSLHLGTNIVIGDTISTIRSNNPNSINHIITSPINGVVNQSTYSDTLITISGLNNFVVIFPIQISNIDLIDIGQEVLIELPEDEITGYVNNIDKTIHYFDGREYSLIFIEIDHITDNLMLRKTITGKVNLGKQSLANQIIKYLN